MTQLEIFLPSGWLKPGRNQTLHSLTREWSSHFPEHSLDSGQLVSCLCRDVFPPSNLWKKWIFFHFLFDSIFSEDQETLGDSKSVGMGWGREGGCFHFFLAERHHLRNSKHIYKATLPCSLGRDTDLRGLFSVPFLGCTYWT